ncbi:MAG: carboxypeptidase regulatory-like domain-containing protein [Acidobacteriota bacterium]
MNLRRTICTLVTLFLAISTAMAAGAIRIKVFDEKDLPLPGATVVLSNKDKLIADMPLITNVQGEAFYPILPVGSNYEFVVTFPGYAPQRVTDIKVTGGDQPQDFLIKMIAEIKEVVKVTGKRELVKTEETQTSTTFSDQFVSELPIAGRDYQSVLSRAPGIMDEDQDGNPNVKGSRERDFKAVIDGVSNVDPLTGMFMSNVNPDAIEDIEVITGGAGAEYSRAQGGFAKITTKQGSNEFSGSTSFYYRSRLLDGNGATNLPKDIFADYKWLNPALSLSGAIIKDKLFWAVSHEYFDIGIPVNTLTSAIVITNKRSRNFDKLTWQVTGKNKLIFQASADPSRWEGLGIDSLTDPESGFIYESGGPTYAITWQVPVSPKLLVTSLVSYSNVGIDILPMTYNAKNNCLYDPSNEDIFPGSTTANCYDIATGETSGSFFRTWRDERQRFTVRTDWEYFIEKFLGTSHRIKTGMIHERERYFREIELRPFIIFWAGQTSDVVIPGQEPRTEFAGYADVYNFIPSTSLGKATGYTTGLYFEDSIKPIRTLTINLGLRVDNEVIDSPGYHDLYPLAEKDGFENILYQAGKDYILRQGWNPDDYSEQQIKAIGADPEKGNGLPPAFSAFTGYENEYYLCATLGDCSRVGYVNYLWQKTRKNEDFQLANTNIAPRLGFSWDPWNKGKSKIYGTFGRYYDKIFLAVPLWEQAPVEYEAIYGLSGQGISGEDARRKTIIDPIPYYTSGVTLTMIDKNIKTPHSDEFTLGFETEIATETSIRLEVNKRDYKDQLQDIDINHYAGDYGDNTKCNPATGTVKLGSQPDGILDDCTGRYEATGEIGNFGPVFNFYPDGIPDIFVANPMFNEIFYIGNFNNAVYKDFEISLNKRRHHHWELQASYVYSVSKGDAEDYAQGLGDDPTTLDDEKGYLSTDQRHVIKINATTEIPQWNFRVGALVTWESGLPYSIIKQDVSLDSNNPYLATQWPAKPRFRTTYPTHQRNDQRNESFWTFDVKFQKDLLIKKTLVSVFADIFNVLNEDRLRIWAIANRRMIGERRFGRFFQVGFKMKF